MPLNIFHPSVRPESSLGADLSTLQKNYTLTAKGPKQCFGIRRTFGVDSLGDDTLGDYWGTTVSSHRFWILQPSDLTLWGITLWGTSVSSYRYWILQPSDLNLWGTILWGTTLWGTTGGLLSPATDFGILRLKRLSLRNDI